ncbi:MAG: hypothetical protein Q9169_007402 [Polycauliona sp. 2 TL-2023]
MLPRSHQPKHLPNHHLYEWSSTALPSRDGLPLGKPIAKQRVHVWHNGSEAPLHRGAQAYGFNTLLLDNGSAVALDIPHPRYVTAVQSLLANDESWNISATVLATVATYNRSKSESDAFASYFESFCEDADTSSGAYTHMTMLNHLAPGSCSTTPSPGDQTLQYVGFVPDPGILYKLYDLNQQVCRGSCSVTRGGIQLLDGSCNGTVAPPNNQEVIVHNTIFLGVWYISSLVEMLGPLCNGKEQFRLDKPVHGNRSRVYALV